MIRPGHRRGHGHEIILIDGRKRGCGHNIFENLRTRT